MHRGDKILRLIALIYDAAENQELWPVFLHELSTALHGNLSAIVTHDKASPGGRVLAIHGGDPEAQVQYEAKHSGANIYAKRAAERVLPGVVAHGGMLCSDDEILRSDYYNEFLRPNDWFYIAGGTIAMDENVVSLISVHRPRRRGQFTEQDLTPLKRVMPHLQRALRLHDNLQRAKTAVATLSCFSTGVINLAASGKVLSFNESARAMLEQRDGLQVDGHGNLNTSSVRSPFFRALVAEAAATGEGRGRHPGSVVSIHRPSGKRPYTVVVSPTHCDFLAFGSVKAAAIAFVTDPESIATTDNDFLGQFYGLTKAESRLVNLMEAGRSLKEAAELNHVSYETVRSQLRTIFSKTGVRRQAELIRLLSRAKATPNH